MQGQALKQMGLYRVESHNKALVGLARAIAKEICGRVGYVDIDMVRTDSRIADYKPSSPNFWGSVFNEVGWRCIDRRPSSKKENHHREIKVWRYEGA